MEPFRRSTDRMSIGLELRGAAECSESCTISQPLVARRRAIRSDCSAGRSAGPITFGYYEREFPRDARVLIAELDSTGRTLALLLTAARCRSIIVMAVGAA